MTHEPVPRLRIGISSCLLGEKVRFDGGHKHDTLLTESLGRFFEWVPVCPEVEIGLGTPRESLRLVNLRDSLRLVAPRSGADHTEAMHRYASRRAGELAALGLHGYILKKDSPSCGMERVRVYNQEGMPCRNGRGLFAAALMTCQPQLPVEEEGRLHDPVLRENFVERVFARHRWLEFRAGQPRAADLVRFHTRHKLTLLSHSEPHYRQLGRLVAAAGRTPFRDVLQQYEELFFAALAVKASPRKHANTLYHLLGFLKEKLDASDKRELVECVERYRRRQLPLIVPITLLAHHFRRHPVDWVTGQTYLHPYPAELMLRNQV